MKNLLLFVVTSIASFSAHAQFNYAFSVRTDTYQPLTSSTSINDTFMWDDEDYAMPIGFTFTMDGRTMDTLWLTEGAAFSTGTSDTVNGLVITDLDLYDRGFAGDSVTRSPIRYTTTGTPGSRIFKMEIANAGIYDEYDLYGTNNDSVYFQIWLYESTNIMEVWFGPSNISHYSDYYYISGSPLHGYVKNSEYNGAWLENFYFFTGNYSSPVIDSTNNLLTISSGLNQHPANGTVYKYTPKPTAIANREQAFNNITIVGNVVNKEIIVMNHSNNRATYDLFSINGTSISQNAEIVPGTNHIDVSSLVPGMYLLHMHNAAGTRVFRISKQ